MFLLDLDRREGWRGTYRNLTGFIRGVAEAMDMQESAVWRILSAGRFYASLGARYEDVSLPPLVEASKAVGAEHIELIEKVSRVAPRRVVANLLSKALDGDLHRDYIRSVWKVYRPETAGKTARGAGLRGEVAARRGKSPARDVLGRGSALFALIETNSDWTGVKATGYKIFPDPLLPKGAPSSCPDILAVVRDAGGCSFHFVDFVSKHLARPGRVLKGRYDGWLPFTDFVWLLSDADLEQLVTDLPLHVGILQVRGGKIRVGRPATHDPRSGGKTGETAKLLVCAAL